jgi:hypothetical protein
MIHTYDTCNALVGADIERGSDPEHDCIRGRPAAGIERGPRV